MYFSTVTAKKPSTIFFSASSSVSPRVRSFTICSPAILPIAASWIREASISPANSSGAAFTLPSPMRMASHSEWPVQRAVPRDFWNDTPDRNDLLQQIWRSGLRRNPLPASPLKICGSLFLTVRHDPLMDDQLRSGAEHAFVERFVRSTPPIWIVSISITASSFNSMSVTGLIFFRPIRYLFPHVSPYKEHGLPSPGKKTVDTVVFASPSLSVWTPQPATIVTSAPSPTKKSL